MTQIYNYSSLTGEFIDISVAPESPLEPGVDIIPAWATTLPPPTTSGHTIAVFKDGAWSITSDYRGVTVYSTTTGDATIINELGPYPIDTTTSPRPSVNHEWDGSTWILDIAKIREIMWNNIKAHRDLLTATGGYLVNGKWFHSDQQSRNQQLGLTLMGNDLPTGIMWKTMDGTFVEMTPALAHDILITACASDQHIFTIAEGHKVAMLESADPFNYDYLSGWPTVYPG